MEIFGVTLDVLRRLAQRAGPYLLVEAVLPGGTLVALLLYLYRARRASPAVVGDLTVVGSSVTVCR